MTKRALIVGSIAMMSLVVAVAAQTAAPQQQTPATAKPAPATPAATGAARPAGTPAPAQNAQAQLVTTAAQEQAMLTQYCIACHSEKAKAAGMDSARKLSIDSLNLANVQEHGEKWELIVRKLRAGMMPPAPMRRPDAPVFESMITYLEGELDRSAVQHMPPPGLHRLNRTEYANMVRDVLGLAIDPAKYLPSDDSTHGFDNIAGALGLSSTLVEAYVSAAQKISRLAIGEAESPTLVVYRAPEDSSQDYQVEGLPFGTRGGLLVPHLFPSDGEYTLTVTPIFGDNMSPTGFGSVPCERIEILLDGDRLQLMPWQGGGRNTPANCPGQGRGQAAGARGAGAGGPNGQAAAAPVTAPAGQAGVEAFFGGRGGAPMRVRFKTTAGEHLVGATFLATNFAPLLDLDRHFMRSTLQTGPTPGYTFFPHVGTIRIEGPFNAEAAKDSPSRRKIFVCTPTGADEAACARKIVTNVATKAFRRPATPADVDLLMQFFDLGRKEGDFDNGVEMVLSRVLASPQFLYRIEEEPAAVKVTTPYRISDVDLASRLSFFLWSTGPDEQLLRLASQNRLKDPVVLEQQVRRMLKDPKAEALAINFAGQWLNLRGIQAHSPLPLIYPDFDDPLRQAMRREVELLFDSIIRDDRNIVDLLTANDTFVNERLAKHYGIPNIYGSQYRHVTLTPEMDFRRGLMGKGVYLTTTAKPERTSPVVRGKWILTNILGMSPPDPPPDVPALPARAGDAAGNAKEPTMRKKMEDHQVRADCVQCHRLMDPVGFALENFDGIALWRDQDEGQPINAASATFDGTKIDGPTLLRNWIVASYSDTFVEVAAEKLLTYGLGRGIEWQDMPLVRSMARDAGKNGNKFSALVLGVVKSKPFQMNMRMNDASAPITTATARPNSNDKGNN